MKSCLPLLLTAATVVAAELPPMHIVQDLPAELNPNLQPAFVPSPNVAKDLDVQRFESDTASVDVASREVACQQAQAEYAKEDAKTEAALHDFMIAAKVQKTPSAEKGTKKKSNSESPSAEAMSGETEITCDDGLYFDSAEGVLVFMRDVSVRNPSLNLDCDNQLKVYMEKAAPSQKKSEESTEKSSAGMPNVNFKDARLVTADGNVVLRRLDEQGRWMVARGEKMTYNVKTQETIMTGGKLSLTYGNSTSSFEGDGAFIRIYPNGSAYVKGAKNKIHVQDLDSFKTPKK